MTTLRRTHIFAALALFLSLAFVLPRSLEARRWTVLAYMAGDNDLSDDAKVDFQTFQTIEATPEFGLVAQCDTDGPEPVRRLVSTETGKALTEMAEVDTGKSATLIDFLKWGREQAPADRYLLIVWGHGHGWKGICKDYSSMGTLALPQLRFALQRGMGQEKGKLEAIVFDSCEMAAVETAYEIRSCARYGVFSQMPIPDRGLPYKGWLSYMAAHPEVETERHLRRLVLQYVRMHSSKGGDLFAPGVTMSAVRLDRIETFVTALGKLISHLGAKGRRVDPWDLFMEGIGPAKTDMYRWDVLGLLEAMPGYAGDPEAIRLIGTLRDLLAYPSGGKDPLQTHLTVTHASPGDCEWSADAWQTIRQEPLEGPDAEGRYFAKLPVGEPGVLEVHYRFVGYDGVKSTEHVHMRHRDYAYTSRFPSHSPFVAEGHTKAGMRGFVLTVLDPFSYDDNQFLYHRMKGYEKLAFSSTPYGAYLRSHLHEFWSWFRWDEIYNRSASVQLVWRRGHPILLYRDREGKFAATQGVTPRVVKRGESLVLAMHCKKNGKLLPYTNRPLLYSLRNGTITFRERRSGRPLTGLTCTLEALQKDPPPKGITPKAAEILRAWARRTDNFQKLHSR